MEQQVITPEELKSLNDFQQQRNQIIDSFGSIEFQISNLKLIKNNLISNLADLNKNSTEFEQILLQKYGNGNIDISTGEFTPQ